MISTELRIGNLAKIQTSLANAAVRETMALDIYLYSRGEASIYPVKLTEEWLLRVKGVNVSVSQITKIRSYSIGLVSVDFIDSGKILSVYVGIQRIISEPKNFAIHQLQNLYFAVTQQELEIN